MKIRSIRLKILAVITVFTLLVGIGASLFVRSYVKSEFQAFEAQRVLQTVNEQSHETKQVLQMGADVAKAVSMNPVIVSYMADPKKGNAGSIAEELAHLNIGGRYSSLYVMDSNGLVHASTDPVFTGNTYAFRQYFREAMAGTPSMQVAIGVTTREVGYYFGHPIRNAANVVIGVAVAKLRPTFVDETIWKSKIGEYGASMIVQKDGIIIYSDKPDRLFKSIGPLSKDDIARIEQSRDFPGISITGMQYQPVQVAMHTYREPTLVTFTDPVDKEEELMSIVRIEGSSLFLVSEISIDDIDAVAVRVATLIAGFVLLANILSTAIIVALVSRFLSPMQTLKAFAMRLSSGVFADRLNIRSGDEFEALAGAFNHMADRLQTMYAGLETTVATKTKDLTARLTEIEDTKRAMLNVLEDLDVSKRKIELEKAKDDALLSSIGDGMIAVDRNGSVTVMNAAAGAMLGINPKTAIGKPYHAVLSVYDERGNVVSMDERPIAKVLATGKPMSTSTLQFSRYDGSKLPVTITVSPIFSGTDHIGTIEIFHDISKEKAVDRAKTEFVSLASHQLKTPLSAIGWYTEMLLNGDAGPISDEQRGYLSEIEHGNKRMVELVNALLNVSRLELGTFTVQPEPINLVEMSRNVLLEMKPKVTANNLTIEERYDESVPVVPADPILMRIIFQNLLSNAVKYTGNGGKVAVSVERVDGSIAISVADTGCGIPKDVQPKIFSKLFRAENAKAIDSDGTGLGLYIIKSIMEQVGGSVRFSSEEGKGTTFTVTLPLTGMVAKAGTRKLSV